MSDLTDEDLAALYVKLDEQRAEIERLRGASEADEKSMDAILDEVFENSSGGSHE